MKKQAKRFTSLLCVLALCMTLLPASALAVDENAEPAPEDVVEDTLPTESTDTPEPEPEESAEPEPEDEVTTFAEGDVAKIGEQTYATLDEAIEVAKPGDTILLLDDATVSKTLDKSITIDGQEHTLTSKDARYGFSKGTKLAFKNVTLNFIYNIEIENPTYTSDLSLFYVNGDTDFTFENVKANFTNTETGATNRLHTFYYDGGSKGTITITDSEFNVTGFPEDVFEWSGSTSTLNVTDSTVILDGNRSGITGTWDVNIANSTFKVLNSIGNGSNGSNYYIKNSFCL